MKAQINKEHLKLLNGAEQETNQLGAKKKELPKIFVRQTFNQALEDASREEIPNMLFGEFVFEQELTVLYTKTNIGKSLLAVQVANTIASGRSLLGLENEAEPQKVLFLDFELSKLQLQFRYAEEYRDSENKRRFKNHYKFHPNLERVTVGKIPSIKGTSLVDLYFESIIAQCEESGSKVIFIDNISWLVQTGLEKMDNARLLMEKLLNLCKNHRYTVFVVAHTPKLKSKTPIYIEDLAGSAGVGNFSDAAFIINDSPALGSPNKYLKQTKVRSAFKKYHEGNVLNVALDKTEQSNIVAFRVTDVEEEYLKEDAHFTFEMESTKKYNEEQVLEAKIKIAKALKENPNLSSRELEPVAGVKHTTVQRYVKDIKENPQLFDGYLNPKTDSDEDSL